MTNFTEHRRRIAELRRTAQPAPVEQQQTEPPPEPDVALAHEFIAIEPEDIEHG